MRQAEQPRQVTLKNRLIAALIVFLIRAIVGTLRLRIDREDETEALMTQSGGMLVTWHGRTLIPIARWSRRRRLRYHMLVSLSRDGDLQAQVFRRCGYGVIRGSTGRRGVAATREILALLDAGDVLTFTPDGPRGPGGVVQPGVVYFAQRSGKPIIPAGIAALPARYLKSWDRFMIPLPFARARWIYGDPIYVQPDEAIEAACERVANAIAALEEQADRELYK